MSSVKLVSILVLCIVIAAPMTTQAAISCGQVTSSLAPCLTYLKTPSAKAPPQTCCDGVRNINSAAQTTPDRQQACKCLKQAAGSISGIIPANAEKLPGSCSVNIPYKISLATNCNNVK